MPAKTDSHKNHKMGKKPKVLDEAPVSKPPLKPYKFPLPENKNFPKPLDDSKNHGKVMFELFEYEATANNIDICRRNNKIYFCK